MHLIFLFQVFLQAQVGIIGFLFHLYIIAQGICRMDSLKRVLPALRQGMNLVTSTR